MGDREQPEPEPEPEAESLGLAKERERQRRAEVERDLDRLAAKMAVAESRAAAAEAEAAARRRLAARMADAERLGQPKPEPGPVPARWCLPASFWVRLWRAALALTLAAWGAASRWRWQRRGHVGAALHPAGRLIGGETAVRWLGIRRVLSLFRRVGARRALRVARGESVGLALGSAAAATLRAGGSRAPSAWRFWWWRTALRWRRFRLTG